MRLALLGVAACGAAVVGLVWWGHDRATTTLPPPDPNAPQPIGPVVALAVGTIVLVDVVRAQLLFVPEPTTLAVVDAVQTDPAVVHVALVAVGAPPGTAPFFTGPIPRTSILRVVASPGPGGRV